MQDHQKNEIFCPFLKSQDETETLQDTFKRLIFKKGDYRAKVDDKLVVELGVVFGGDAALQVNKHANCHHHKRNHHRQLQKLR